MAKQFHDPTKHPFGPAVGNLVDQFARLPGIGRKSAERLAQHVLMCDSQEAFDLSDSIRAVKTRVRTCRECFNLTELEVCNICGDPRRDHQSICILEQPRDVLMIEGSRAFDGVYHVLQGRLSPLEGIGPEQLTIDALVKRIRRDSVTELVMATNPTLEGDGTALFISNILANDPVKITRLARGIATGSVLEFANKEMLADAMKGRQSF